MGKGLDLLVVSPLAFLGAKDKDYHTWLFSSNENVHFDSNARYLFEYVKEQVPEVHPLFVINDEELKGRLSQAYGPEYFLETRSLEGKKRALRAGVWFTSAGLPVYGFGLGRGRLVINLWHGLPLKRIALADQNLSRITRFLFHQVFSKSYYRVVTSSKTFVPIMSEAFGVSRERVAIWGQPRCDALLMGEGPLEEEKRSGRNPKGEGAKNWREEPALEGERVKRILYAPTFRDWGETRLFPFEDYDKEALDAFLKQEDALIYLRLHHLDQTSPQGVLSDRVRILGTEQVEDVTASLGKFDLLITDYSSIYIDYLLLNRPILFLPYDQERYLQGRGMYFPYEEVTPGSRPKTQRELLAELKGAFEGVDRFAPERERVGGLFSEVREPCCGRIVEETKRALLKELGVCL